MRRKNSFNWIPEPGRTTWQRFCDRKEQVYLMSQHIGKRFVGPGVPAFYGGQYEYLAWMRLMITTFYMDECGKYMCGLISDEELEQADKVYFNQDQRFWESGAWSLRYDFNGKNFKLSFRRKCLPLPKDNK